MAAIETTACALIFFLALFDLALVAFIIGIRLFLSFPFSPSSPSCLS